MNEKTTTPSVFITSPQRLLRSSNITPGVNVPKTESEKKK